MEGEACNVVTINILIVGPNRSDLLVCSLRHIFILVCKTTISLITPVTIAHDHIKSFITLIDNLKPT